MRETSVKKTRAMLHKRIRITNTNHRLVQNIGNYTTLRCTQVRVVYERHESKEQQNSCIFVVVQPYPQEGLQQEW